MNDEIRNLIELNDDQANVMSDFDCLFQNDSCVNESLNLQIQRDRLIDWLVKNHLPVRLDSMTGVINILDSVFICSPYGVEQCESTNEIILERVRQLVLKINKNNM